MLKREHVSLLMLTVWVPMMAVGNTDSCYRTDVDPSLDGCSVPFGLPFPFKRLFTPSCNRHDICYRCGMTFGLSQRGCDLWFKDDTYRSCEKRYMAAGGIIHVQSRSGQYSNKSFLDLDLDDYSSNAQMDIIAEQAKHDAIKTIRQMRAQMDGIFDKHFSKFVDEHSRSVQNTTDFEQTLQISIRLSTLKQNVIRDWLDVFKNETSQRGLEEGEEPDVRQRSGMTVDVSTTINGLFKIHPIFSQDTEELLLCYLFSNLYFSVVRLFGGKYYRNPSLDYCQTQQFVPDCLDGYRDYVSNYVVLHAKNWCIFLGFIYIIICIVCLFVFLFVCVFVHSDLRGLRS